MLGLREARAGGRGEPPGGVRAAAGGGPVVGGRFPVAVSRLLSALVGRGWGCQERGVSVGVGTGVGRDGVTPAGSSGSRRYLIRRSAA